MTRCLFLIILLVMVFFPKEEKLYSKSWYAIKRNEHIGLKYQ